MEGPWVDALASIAPFDKARFRVLGRIQTPGDTYVYQRSTSLYNDRMLVALPSVPSEVVYRHAKCGGGAIKI